MIYKKDATGLLQSLLGLSHGPWRWSAGVQASVATAVPLAPFTLTGHQSLGLLRPLPGARKVRVAVSNFTRIAHNTKRLNVIIQATTEV